MPMGKDHGRAESLFLFLLALALRYRQRDTGSQDYPGLDVTTGILYRLNILESRPAALTPGAPLSQDELTEIRQMTEAVAHHLRSDDLPDAELVD